MNRAREIAGELAGPHRQAKVAMTLVNSFILSAGIILLATGAAKIAGGFGRVRILEVSDPVFRIAFGRLFILAGILEVLVSLVCLWPTANKKLALGVIAWLSSNFALYRLGLLLVGWHRPCGCLGILTDVFHLDPLAAHFVSLTLLVYLLVGSYLANSWIYMTPQA